ncbi:three-helix bundle dimerization domain-containing protein [Rhodococcus jostii]|uniref:three-helix bundle dimerization domain-containing protein n=1 Tax=Rhodococcus jostii TaxID=132919 RepID=UPI00363B9F03
MNSAEEARRISQVTLRLLARFPTASRESVQADVEGAVARFEGTRIRDFVPLLVERTANAKLTSSIER